MPESKRVSCSFSPVIKFHIRNEDDKHARIYKYNKDKKEKVTMYLATRMKVKKLAPMTIVCQFHWKNHEETKPNKISICIKADDKKKGVSRGTP